MTCKAANNKKKVYIKPSLKFTVHCYVISWKIIALNKGFLSLRSLYMYVILLIKWYTMKSNLNHHKSYFAIMLYI